LVLTGIDLSADDSAALRQSTNAVFLKNSGWRTDLLEMLRKVVTSGVNEDNSGR
jgi:hypothetical protein